MLGDLPFGLSLGLLGLGVLLNGEATQAFEPSIPSTTSERQAPRVRRARPRQVA